MSRLPTLLPATPPLRFAAFAVLAIVVPAAILAVLGYVSLRQWQTSADLLFREQSRNMAAMAAEKVDMALRHLEDDTLGRLETVLATDAAGGPAALRRFVAETPLVGRLALFDRAGPAGPSTRPGRRPSRRRLWAARWVMPPEPCGSGGDAAT